MKNSTVVQGGCRFESRPGACLCGFCPKILSAAYKRDFSQATLEFETLIIAADHNIYLGLASGVRA